MADHVIRLRGPWNYYYESVVQQGTCAGTVKVPQDWHSWCQDLRSDTEENVLVTFVRRFGLPTGLTAGDRLDLVIDGRLPIAELSLNGRLLMCDTCATRVDITHDVLPTNELTLKCSIPCAQPPEFPHVQLEIFHFPMH